MGLKEGEQTIVFGLDGADLELLKPWIADGELPALQQILDEGVSGDLASVCPPVTSPNWKAYLTGKNPGKLGIFWWWNTDTENEKTYRPTDRYNVQAEFWEYLAEVNPVGVIGVPTTYPPKSVGSFVVSGAPDADKTGFTYPESLESDLRDQFGYRVTRDHLMREGRDEAYDEVLELIDMKFKAAQYLLERFDLAFLQVTTFHINLLQHTVWDDEVTLAGWKTIDQHLASFLEEDVNVVVMSDHGMAEIKTVFRINQWLEQEGYLVHEATSSQLLHDLGISSDQVKKLLTRVNRTVPGIDLDRVANDVTPQWVLNRLPDADGELGASKHSQIDWGKSEVLAGQLGPIYLLADPDSERYEQLREELIYQLERLHDPNGTQIASAVVRAEELYSGSYVGEGPDLIIIPERGVHIAEGIGPADVFSSQKDAWRAVNARYGMFAATGPAFTTGTVSNLSILDLAPTLLHLYDQAIPSDMDGTVRNDLFAKGSTPETRSPRYTEPRRNVPSRQGDSEARDIEEELQDLGYL